MSNARFVTLIMTKIKDNREFLVNVGILFAKLVY